MVADTHIACKGVSIDIFDRFSSFDLLELLKFNKHKFTREKRDNHRLNEIEPQGGAEGGEVFERRPQDLSQALTRRRVRDWGAFYVKIEKMNKG